MRNIKIKTATGLVNVIAKATAGKGTLNITDLLKGLLIAALTPVIVILQQSLDAGHLVFDLKALIIAAVAGGSAYLLKNLFTPSFLIIKGKDLPE
jgi:hypothetical protein